MTLRKIAANTGYTASGKFSWIRVNTGEYKMFVVYGTFSTRLLIRILHSTRISVHGFHLYIASTYAAFVYFRLQIRTQYSPRIHQDFVCGFRICDVYPVCRPVSCLPGIRVTQGVLYSIELWTALALRGLERIQRLTFYLKLRYFLEVWGHDDLVGLVMCFLWLKRSANQIRNCKFYDPTCLEGQYLFPSHSELRNFKP